MTVSPGMVLYPALPLPTGAVVAFRVRSRQWEGPPGALGSHALWLVDVMRVETRGRDEVSVTQDTLYEFELERMRRAP